jgi:predicted dehydrogenase
VNTYDIKLAIIGRGAWPSKIKSSLESNFQNLDAEIFSARDVVSNSKLVQENLFNVIWIATQPSLQLKLLKKLLNGSQTIIFEKPLGSNSAEIDSLIQFLQEHSSGAVAPSNPWTFETTCLEAVELMKNQGLEAAKVEITRRGPNRRSYLSPVGDWIPHDLYLLEKIFVSESITFNKIVGTRESAVANFFCKGFQTQVTVNSGYAQERVSEIIYSKNSTEIRANILSGKISINGTTHNFRARDSYDAISRNYLDAKNWGRERFINTAKLQSEVFSSLEKLK